VGLIRCQVSCCLQPVTLCVTDWKRFSALPRGFRNSWRAGRWSVDWARGETRNRFRGRFDLRSGGDFAQPGMRIFVEVWELAVERGRRQQKVSFRRACTALESRRNFCGLGGLGSGRGMEELGCRELGGGPIEVDSRVATLAAPWRSTAMAARQSAARRWFAKSVPQAEAWGYMRSPLRGEKDSIWALRRPCWRFRSSSDCCHRRHSHPLTMPYVRVVNGYERT